MIDTHLPTLRPTVLASLDEIQAAAITLLLEEGVPSTPRGRATREVVGVAFGLENPRRRFITVPARRWSLPLALGEFCWHMSGSDDSRALEYYSKRWRNFADDDHRIRGSCYGRTIFRDGPDGINQWQRIVQTLTEDSASRRGVAILFDPGGDVSLSARDVACVNSLQFMIRASRLDAVVSMRSNDVVWGLPYDVFLFTMMQEFLAVTLGIETGTYYHFVGSLHLYDSHAALAEQIVAGGTTTGPEMPPMARPEQLPDFLVAEELLRKGSTASSPRLPDLHHYWRELTDVLSWFANWRANLHSVSPAIDHLRRSPYDQALRGLANPA